jgi:hypothetical protein
LLLVQVAEGAVHRWVDDDGQVHYSDISPGEDTEKIELPEPEPVSSAEEEKDMEQEQKKIQKELDVYREEQEEQRLADEKVKKERQQRERNCNEAHDRLKQYQTAGALYDLTPDGKRRILSDEERTEAEAKAQQDVVRWCG